MLEEIKAVFEAWKILDLQLQSRAQEVEHIQSINLSDEQLNAELGKWNGYSVFNTHAYFALLFAKLEESLIRKAEEIDNNLRSPNVRFEEKLKAAAGRCNFTAEQTAVIQEFYEERCEIAHGRGVASEPAGVEQIYSFIMELPNALWQ